MNPEKNLYLVRKPMIVEAETEEEALEKARADNVQGYLSLEAFELRPDLENDPDE